MGKLRSETPPMVKWIRMLGKNESHYVVFRAGKKTWETPRILWRSPKYFFLWSTLKK